MRKILWLVPILCLCGFVHGQAFVAAGVCFSGGATCNVTLSPTAGYVAGQTIACFVGSNTFAGNVLSCTDTNSDTFVCGTVQANGTTEQGVMCIATAGTTNASGVVTPTVTQTANNMQGAAAVFSGGYTVVDQSNCGANFTTTASATSGPCTTGTASEILVGGFGLSAGTGSGITASGSWTLADSPTGITNSAAEVYQIVSSTGSYTATATCGTATCTGVGVLTTLKKPVSGAPANQWPKPL